MLQDYNQECRRKAEYARILPPVVSARFTTRKSFSFKYGKMEIRAKLPKGDWLYPRKQNLIYPLDVPLALLFFPFRIDFGTGG